MSDLLMTPREYVTKHRITATVKGGEIKRDTRDGWEHRAWQVTLTASDGATLRIPYRTGLALTETPTAADVIGSLSMEQGTDASSFEAFCGELGYDTDSRAAEADWKVLRRQQQDVAEWLDDDALAELIHVQS